MHFAIDVPRAQALEDRWVRLGMSRLALELVECPDRRVVRAALEMADEAAADGQTEVSVLLPRRSYTLAWSRLLHDSVGSESRPPSAGWSTSTPPSCPLTSKASYGTDGRVNSGAPVVPPTEGDEREQSIDARMLGRVTGTTPIPALHPRQRARVAGRVRSLTVQPWGDVPTLQVQLTDDQGRLTVAFLGRRQIAGLVPGSRIIVDGTVTERRGRLLMINPDYEFVPTSDAG